MALRKLLIFIFSILTIITCESCLRNEFDMEAKLDEKVNHTYNISYYASDRRGGLEIVTALDVRGGEGKLKGMTRNPTLGLISYGNSSLPAAIFFAERGDKIVFPGDDPSPEEWNISGNKINELLSEWRLTNKELIAKVRDNVSDSGEKSRSVRKKLNKKIAEFVRTNPESGASALILGVYFDSAEEPSLDAELWKILEKSGVMADYSPLLARQDCDFSSVPSAPVSRLSKKVMIVQSYWNNYDTLHLGNGKHPVLMYFNLPNDENRGVAIDSLKRLSKLRKDSLDLQIVDFSLAPDSSIWSYNVRRDSLKNTLCSWTPRGFAEPDLMNLGVSETPMWLIVDKNGKVIYRRVNIYWAMKEARKLIKKAGKIK